VSNTGTVVTLSLSLGKAATFLDARFKTDFVKEDEGEMIIREMLNAPLGQPAKCTLLTTFYAAV
jgi:hypothetical protein